MKYVYRNSNTGCLFSSKIKAKISLNHIGFKHEIKDERKWEMDYENENGKIASIIKELVL